MRVLVACECSGKVRQAFRARGADAWSNDILPADDGSAHHIVGDCLEAINRKGPWDIIIVHPPCTALAVSGNRWYGSGAQRHHERIAAVKWTTHLWAACKDKTRIGACLENPVGVLPFKPAQYIQPWEFGHGETKKTGLWLYNLPKLQPTNSVAGREQRIWRLPPSADRAKIRSETYQGIADAMADQWGPK